MPDVVEIAAQSAPSASVIDRCVCINVQIGSLGNSKKIPASTIRVDADAEWVRASKQLLDSEELVKIKKVDGEIRSFLGKICLPSMFRSGVYLLPIRAVERAEERLGELKRKREDAVDAFVAVYEERVREAQELLRELFSPSDYKAPTAVKGKFEFSWNYVTFSTPGALKGVRPELFQREQEKAAAQWKEATDEIRDLLRKAMSEFTAHLVDRLRPAEDGKKKIIQERGVAAFKEFLENFDIRNVTDDAELKALVQRARSLLDGGDIDAIRNNDTFRANLLGNFQQIQQSVESLVGDRPVRAMQFDDEDVAEAA